MSRCMLLWILLAVFTKTGGQTLCDTDGMLEVVENTTTNVFTCTSINSSYTVEWILKNGDTDLSTCPPRPKACTDKFSYFTASRPANNTSTLTLDGSTKSLNIIQGHRIICKKSSGSTSTQQTECQVDVVAIPSVTCDAHYNTGNSSPWTVTVNCSMSGAYSYLNRYTCQLVQTSPSTKNLGSVNMTVTSTTSGKYKSGTCDVTVPYPDITGVYSYKMVVTPGRKNVSAMFGGQSNFEISRPSTQPSHTCPQYVLESQGASCTCTATDPGQPPGVVRWTSTGTNQLLLSNVNKTQNGAEYTCEIMWSNQHVQSVNYILQVASPPSTPVISKPSNYPFIATVTQAANLTCHSTTPGVPASNYTWPVTQGGREGTDAQGHGTLTFDTVGKELNGTNVGCRASNWFTDNKQRVPEGTFMLEIYFNPEITFETAESNQCDISSSESKCVVAEGQRVHIRCSASSSPSPEHITWQGTSGMKPDLLLIESANHTQHTGVYNCSVTTGRGNHGNDSRLPLKAVMSFAVIVNYPPSISSFEVNSSSSTTLTVNASDVLDLSCRAVGRPPPQTKLIHPNTNLIPVTSQGSTSSDDTSSVVSGKLIAQCRDTGIYTCNVENIVGNAQQQVSILVQCGPIALNGPVDGQSPEVNFRIEAVQLTFKVAAYPPPKLKEIKVFKQQPDGTTVSQDADKMTVAVKCVPDSNVSADVTCHITVDNMTSANAGLYKAVVSNAFGELKLEFEVKVNATAVDSGPDFTVAAVVCGIVAAVIVAAVVIIVVVLVRRRRRRKGKANMTHSHERGYKSLTAIRARRGKSMALSVLA